MRFAIQKTVPLALLASTAPLTAAITTANAEAAFHQLQTWYNQSNGLWIPSTGWWNSANCLTVVADLAAIDGNVKAQSQYIYLETWAKAQVYNLQMQKTIGSNWLPWTYYGGPGQWPQFPHDWPKPPFQQTNGFLNGYYDDEGNRPKPGRDSKR